MSAIPPKSGREGEIQEIGKEPPKTAEAAKQSIEAPKLPSKLEALQAVPIPQEQAPVAKTATTKLAAESMISREVSPEERKLGEISNDLTPTLAVAHAVQPVTEGQLQGKKTAETRLEAVFKKINADYNETERPIKLETIKKHYEMLRNAPKKDENVWIELTKAVWGLYVKTNNMFPEKTIREYARKEFDVNTKEKPSDTVLTLIGALMHENNPLLALLMHDLVFVGSSMDFMNANKNLEKGSWCIRITLNQTQPFYLTFDQLGDGQPFNLPISINDRGLTVTGEPKKPSTPEKQEELPTMTRRNVSAILDAEIGYLRLIKDKKNQDVGLNLSSMVLQTGEKVERAKAKELLKEAETDKTTANQRRHDQGYYQDSKTNKK